MNEFWLFMDFLSISHEFILFIAENFFAAFFLFLLGSSIILIVFRNYCCRCKLKKRNVGKIAIRLRQNAALEIQLKNETLTLIRKSSVNDLDLYLANFIFHSLTFMRSFRAQDFGISPNSSNIVANNCVMLSRQILKIEN